MIDLYNRILFVAKKYQNSFKYNFDEDIIHDAYIKLHKVIEVTDNLIFIKKV